MYLMKFIFRTVLDLRNICEVSTESFHELHTPAYIFSKAFHMVARRAKQNRMFEMVKSYLLKSKSRRLIDPCSGS